ncbi:MAG: DsbC family protein [Desulfuromonadaceae bacterium]|nr:DsbC family protein [Desulfuromonas sp.]MDY0185939.1 DsbC family protein [Desulfuromonadaceae bacterium]
MHSIGFTAIKMKVAHSLWIQQGRLVSGVFLLFLVCMPTVVLAFGEGGCGAGECRDCHSLDAQEALKLLPPGADKINSVNFSEVGGLWRVDGEAQGSPFSVYIDFSKKYIIAGNVIRIKDGANIDHRVDVEQIPTAGAITLGAASAPVVLHVFTDVRCSYCKILHQDLEKLVATTPEIKVQIHLLPIMMDKKLAAALGCSNSAQMLRAAYDSQGDTNLMEKLAPCDSTGVDAIETFARKWKLNSTPSMVLPDGQVVRGARPLETLKQMLQPFIPQT